MNISVVVVCYNEKDKIANCIKSILKQNINNAKFEIVVVDNGSNDGTMDIIKELCIKDKRVRMIVNPIKGIATSRNIGLKEAQYEYIAFTDADCVVPENWLKVFRDGYDKVESKDKMVVALGGANLPPKNHKFYEALDITLKTFWGNHGSTQGKIFKKDTYVKHIPTVNILYKKDILLKNNGFDESFGNICEDTELNHRLTMLGYKFVFLKDSYVWHFMRDNLRSWAKNIFTYGKGRIWVIKKHFNHFHIMYIIPICLFLSILITPLGLWYWWFFIPLVYFPIIFFLSLWDCLKSKKMKLVFSVFSIYIVDHIFYGIGELYGIVKKRGN